MILHHINRGLKVRETATKYKCRARRIGSSRYFINQTIQTAQGTPMQQNRIVATQASGRLSPPVMQSPSTSLETVLNRVGRSSSSAMRSSLRGLRENKSLLGPELAMAVLALLSGQRLRQDHGLAGSWERGMSFIIEPQALGVVAISTRDGPFAARQVLSGPPASSGGTSIAAKLAARLPR